MDFLRQFLTLTGRIFLSSFFFWGAWKIATGWDAAYASYQASGVALVPLLLMLALSLQLIGALSLLLGFKTTWGAVLLICFTIFSAIFLHDFWHVSGSKKQAVITLFLIDTALTGALLQICVFGAGRYSIDRK